MGLTLYGEFRTAKGKSGLGEGEGVKRRNQKKVYRSEFPATEGEAAGWPAPSKKTSRGTHKRIVGSKD